MNIPPANPLAVPCPICNAPAGIQCTDLYGYMRAIPHVERGQTASAYGNRRQEIQ
jgi:hypothetical protein